MSLLHTSCELGLKSAFIISPSCDKSIMSARLLIFYLTNRDQPLEASLPYTANECAKETRTAILCLIIHCPYYLVAKETFQERKIT